MQERPRGQVLKIRTHASQPAHLLVEENATPTTVKRIADFLEGNTIITTITIHPPLGDDKQGKLIKAHLARNLQIQQATALVLQDVLKKLPVNLEENIVEEHKKASELAQSALEGDATISSTELTQCLQRLIALFTHTSKEPVHAHRLDDIVIESSGGLKNLISVLDDKQKEEKSTYLEKLILAKSLIDEFELNALEAGRVPLHIAAIYNMTDFMLKLIALGASPNAKDRDDITPLHAAAYFGSLEATQTLVEKFGVGINDDSAWGTPMHLSQVAKQDEVTRYLASCQKTTPKSSFSFFGSRSYKPEKPGEIDMEKLQAGRRLFYVLGGEKLDKLESTKGTFLHASGGRDTEGYETLATYMQDFAETLAHDSLTYQRLMRIQQRLQKAVVTPVVHKTKSPSKAHTSLLKAKRKHKRDVASAKQAMFHQLANAEKNERFILVSGFLTHMIAVSIEKLADGQFKLTLAERGPLATRDKSASNQEGNVTPIRSLTFAPNHLMSVIDSLYSACETDLKNAEKILLEHIPTITTSSYIINPTILQPPYKHRICFFANPKSLVRDEMIKELGDKEGNALYKAFTLYMRERAVSDYEKIAGSKDAHVKAGKKVLSQNKADREFKQLLSTLSNNRLKKVVEVNIDKLLAIPSNSELSRHHILKLILNRFDEIILQLMMQEAHLLKMIMIRSEFSFQKLLSLDTDILLLMLSNIDELTLILDDKNENMKLNDLIKLRPSVLKDVLNIDCPIVCKDYQITIRDFIKLPQATRTLLLENPFKTWGLFHNNPNIDKQKMLRLPFKDLETLLKNRNSNQAQNIIKKLSPPSESYRM